MRIMKRMNVKVDKDVEALADDIRRVRHDLADLLGSARHRARRLRSEDREAAVYVAEPGPPQEEVVVKRSLASARILAVVFALGAVAAALLMRRSKVTVSRWRPGFRRVATRTVKQEPFAEEVPLRTAHETVIPEEARTEGLPLR